MSASVVERLSRVRESEFPEDWYELADDAHFWMQWRLRVALRLCAALGSQRERELAGLDIGCGAGQFRRQVEQQTRWRVDATDLNLAALEAAPPARGRTLYYDVTERAPQLVGSYDVVFLFDVIEHVAAPRELVSASLAHLRTGGLMLVNVPALPRLESAYDAAAGHLRRYGRRTLASEFEGLSCRVERTLYWGLSLVPLLVARKLVVGRQPDAHTIRRGFRPPTAAVNEALRLLMKLELAVSLAQPLGTSVMAAVRKV